VETSAAVYEGENTNSRVVEQVAVGDCLLMLDAPGKFRQVMTFKQNFGFLPPSAKVEEVDLLSNEVFDRESWATAQALGPPKKMESAGLTDKQIAIALIFGLAAFAGLFLVLVKLGD
jgi:hypothetical protein